jgi:hypothetical protein
VPALFAIVIASAILIIYFAAQPGKAPTEGPYHSLPASVTAAGAISTQPGVWSSAQAGAFRVSRQTEDNTSATAALLGGAFPTDIWADTDTSDWVGPRLARGWLTPGINASSSQSAVAVEVTDQAAAQTWADTHLPVSTYAHKFVTADGITSLVIVPFARADVLNEELLDTSAEYEPGSVAVGWVNLETTATPDLVTSPMFETFTSAGLVSTEMTGTISGSLTFSADKATIVGTMSNVTSAGAPVAGNASTNLNGLVTAPKRSTSVVQVLNPQRFTASTTVESRWRGIVEELDREWDNAGEFIGTNVTVAVGPNTPASLEASESPVWGWKAFGADPQTATDTVTGFLEPNTRLTYTVVNNGDNVVGATTPEWAQQLSVPVKGKTVADGPCAPLLTGTGPRGSLGVVVAGGPDADRPAALAATSCVVVIIGAADADSNARFSINAV